MREIRLSGSEEGEPGLNRVSLPLSNVRSAAVVGERSGLQRGWGCEGGTPLLPGVASVLGGVWVIAGPS
jgi:hypothetical protein